MMRHVAAACILAGISGPIVAQQVDVGRWELEQVVTADGKTYRGLISAERKSEIEFIEVVRPRGKPMYLVVRPLATSEIASQKRLPADERKLLAQRIYAFRYRSRIEAGRMDDIELTSHEQDERTFLRYRGPWFILDSTANEELTRRCIVRTEQIFRAYRQILPPRQENGRALRAEPLRIVLLASLDDYQTYLSKFELKIDNPAIYSQPGNFVVVGGELSRFADRLAIARNRHEEIRRQYENLDKQMDERLAVVRMQLREAGVARSAIDDEINARKKQWKDERDEAMLLLNTADRRNDRRFDELTETMFARLYHEALHAYLENYLYPQSQFEVPIWLHEGLAQFFQNGRLEADTLRIDSPLGTALAIAQQDIKSETPISLADLLAADSQDFLTREDRHKYYAHAWALVYYLAIERAVIGTETLDKIVPPAVDADAQAEGAEITRFQSLVDQPLFDFEQQWHAAVLELSP